MNYEIRIGWIVGLEMYSIVMRTIHTFVHHEDAGFNCDAFAGLKYHRTDGQFGRSAPLQYFNIRLFFESQIGIPGVCNLYSELAVLAELHKSIIDLVLVYF